MVWVDTPVVKSAGGQQIEANTTAEVTLLTGEGTEVPVNISSAELPGDSAGSAVFCGVVTELSHANRLAAQIEARSASEGAVKLALDAAAMGSWDLDMATGAIRRSRRYDQIFGYADPQPTGDLLEMLAHFIAADRPLVRHEFSQAELTGSIDIEARIRRRSDAEICWVHLKGQTFYSADSPVRITGVIADVTHRRTAEERLRQVQKMESLSQLTGGVAHDFNNLLQVISGGLQILDGEADAARRERMFGAMKQAVARGAGLCRQLLAFSRRHALRPEAVDLQPLIGGMRDLWDRGLRGDVTIQADFAQNLWPVEVDTGELELVILNLADNAREAMPTGGTIKICVSNAPDVADHELKGDYVRLDIIDEGVGMSEVVLVHAFEPFFTTKDVGKGSGLGLAQTHGFARASGGVVRITSAPDCGTTVSLFLPRTRKSLASADASPADMAIEAAPSVGQLLLVEDDDEVATLAVEMINQLGYDTMRVASAEAALGALAGERAVDIVFSDVMMPGRMNGVELAREIRRRRPNLPVLLSSGFAEAASRSAAVHHIKILSKPYRMDELRDALATARQDARKSH